MVAGVHCEQGLNILEGMPEKIYLEDLCFSLSTVKFVFINDQMDARFQILLSSLDCSKYLLSLIRDSSKEVNKFKMRFRFLLATLYLTVTVYKAHEVSE